MSKHIQLHIPEPCHEKWNNMTPVEKGRFCGSCQKQVVDFTNMNDEQVVAFFKRQTTGSVCGRFMQDQLDRSIVMPKKRIPWVKYFFQFALPAFLLSTKASTQGKVRVLTGDTVVMPVIPKVEAVNLMADSEKKRERIIRGKVIDETDEGISYATIFIKGSTTGVAADSTGDFSLKYNGTEDSCVLTSSCVGFGEVETLVDLNSGGGPVVIQMMSTRTPFEDEVFVGMVIRDIGEPLLIDISDVDTITTPEVVTTTIFDTARTKIFASNSVYKIYPNPLSRREALTIEMKKQEKGTYLLQLSAMNGQVILNKELWIDENNRIVTLHIPPIATGTYLLTMINKKSGKHNTDKIIIE